MLNSFKQFVESHFIDNNALGKPDSHDIALAAATLMFEVIKSDSEIHLFENQHMSELLCQKFGLSEEEVNELTTIAQDTSDAAVSLHSFTRKICESWSNEQRCELIADLWSVALADGKIDVHERHVIRKIAALLYMTDAQIAHAKEMAKLKQD